MKTSNVVCIGKIHRIEWAVKLNGHIPAADFFNNLSKKERARLMALFKLLGDNKYIANQQQFKKIRDTGFFEFKRFQVRMICFFYKNSCVIVTNGFIKKQNRIPIKEIERAKQIMMEDIERRERDDQ